MEEYVSVHFKASKVQQALGGLELSAQDLALEAAQRGGDALAAGGRAPRAAPRWFSGVLYVPQTRTRWLTVRMV